MYFHVQIDISGKDAKSFLEYILVADVSKLRIGSGTVCLPLSLPIFTIILFTV